MVKESDSASFSAIRFLCFWDFFRSNGTNSTELKKGGDGSWIYQICRIERARFAFHCFLKFGYISKRFPSCRLIALDFTEKWLVSYMNYLLGKTKLRFVLITWNRQNSDWETSPRITLTHQTQFCLVQHRHYNITCGMWESALVCLQSFRHQNQIESFW